MKTMILSVAIAAMLLALPVHAATATAAKGALDGKSYAVVVSMPGNKTSDDTISFKDGKIECALSKTQGYAPAVYTAKPSGKAMEVSAEMKDAKGDTRTISAVITDEKMIGTMVAHEGGKTTKMSLAPKPATVAAAPGAASTPLITPAVPSKQQ